MPQGVPRKVVAAALRPLLPRGRKGWKVEASSRNVDVLDVPVVQIKQRRLERNTVAPAKVWDCELIITLWAPQTTTEAAEDALDDDYLPRLLDALEQIDGILWEDATKVRSDDDQRLGYDIRTTIPLVKE
jgi:hypothetical protein